MILDIGCKHYQDVNIGSSYLFLVHSKETKKGFIAKTLYVASLFIVGIYIFEGPDRFCVLQKIVACYFLF